ncbi:m-AAA protease-interacting protein 1, mitochondrial [Augochlora pura]
MFSLMFKKYTFRSQVREFATLFINSKNRINRKVIKNFTNVNCAGLMNRDDRTYYRPFSSATDEIPFLPPLMNIPLYKFPTMLSFIYRFMYTAQVQMLIDKTFNFQEFTDGSKQAIITISQALAARSYEELDGLVDEITIEMLKMRVDRLTTEQRNLIPVTDKNLICYINVGMAIKDHRVAVGMNCDKIVEISQLGFYCNSNMHDKDPKDIYRGIVENNNVHLITINYTFQRCYNNGVGGPWIVTIANHFTSTS